MWEVFVKRLVDRQVQFSTDLVLMLNPRLPALPLPIQRFDDPFFPFGKAVIDASADRVCGYVLDLASYLALGAAGARALERTIRYIGKDIPKILHGPFVGTGYSVMADEIAFGVDALTIIQPADLQHYLDNPPYAAFVVSNRPMDTVDAAERGGFFWTESKTFTLRGLDGGVLQLRMTGDDVLYAGKYDDFAARMRERLEQLL